MSQIKSFYKSKERNKIVVDSISFTAVILFTALTLLPIWWIIRSSFMNNAEVFGTTTFLPKNWQFSNYNFNPSVFNYFKLVGNSLMIVVPCVVFGTVTAVFCGYAFARLRFKGKKFLFSLCVGSMLLPGMVTLIPLFIVWAKLGLVDTYWPLVLPYLCGGGAFNIFLIRQFFMTIPKELDEAASIDGAGYMRTLMVLLPSIKPAIIVVALLIFITNWNDLLTQTIYINSPDKFTLVMGLKAFVGSFSTDYGKMFAAICLSFLPGTIIYLIGQKYFVEGIVMTGMKN
ncbi:MAG: carbohydrate ABC transporter permease [Treponema sp.]|nr:carbohydrate ABC transporter permease [Treponema sp.]